MHSIIHSHFCILYIHHDMTRKLPLWQCLEIVWTVIYYIMCIYSIMCSSICRVCVFDACNMWPLFFGFYIFYFDLWSSTLITVENLKQQGIHVYTYCRDFPEQVYKHFKWFVIYCLCLYSLKNATKNLLIPVNFIFRNFKGHCTMYALGYFKLLRK